MTSVLSMLNGTGDGRDHSFDGGSRIRQRLLGERVIEIEYDPWRDLLYIWFRTPEEKAVRTEVIAPEVHADFNGEGMLIGIEMLDATEVVSRKVQLEVALTTPPRETATRPS